MKKRWLIDIDKIKPIDFPSTEMDGLDVVRYLNTLPTVDAVEVVRCKDCKYRKEPENRLCNPYCTKHLSMQAKDDYFCSCGERKTDG